jgi:hypothetical protein
MAISPEESWRPSIYIKLFDESIVNWRYQSSSKLWLLKPTRQINLDQLWHKEANIGGSRRFGDHHANAVCISCAWLLWDHTPELTTKCVKSMLVKFFGEPVKIALQAWNFSRRGQLYLQLGSDERHTMKICGLWCSVKDETAGEGNILQEEKILRNSRRYKTCYMD